MVYKCVYEIAREYLSNLLCVKQSLESLRVYSNKTLLYEPRLEKENYRNRKFEVAGPREWNLLPRSLREISSLETFKARLKTFFFNQFWCILMYSCNCLFIAVFLYELLLFIVFILILCYLYRLVSDFTWLLLLFFCGDLQIKHIPNLFSNI